MRIGDNLVSFKPVPPVVAGSFRIMHDLEGTKS
jgi:hypothetical protein